LVSISSFIGVDRGDGNTNMCTWCAIGCVVECRICNREVTASNLGRDYFAPRSTQPSIHPGSVNEHQLRLGMQRQVCLIPIAVERVGVQVKLWNPLRTRAIPECFCGDDSLRRGAISSVRPFTFNITLLVHVRKISFSSETISASNTELNPILSNWEGVRSRKLTIRTLFYILMALGLGPRNVVIDRCYCRA